MLDVLGLTDIIAQGMVDATTSDEVPPDDAGLELERWGTRFAVAEVERQYESWRFLRSSLVHRAAIFGSATLWATVTVMSSVFRSPALPWCLGAFALVFAALAGMYVSVRRQSYEGWNVASPVANALSGLVAVGVGNLYFGLHTATYGAVILGVFFQFGFARARLLPLGVAIAAYCLAQQLVSTTLYLHGTMTGVAFAIETWLLASCFVMAGSMAAVSDADLRRSFRQERIIEAQKLTIARERARSEALLKRELSHQVAERSRELGAVLAKSDVSLDARKLAAGERFAGRYKIIAALGAGGMGAVYEVERVTDGEKLALKVVVGEVSGVGAARFAREAEIGARVHHANLVSIVDVGVSEGVPFLAMELVRGGSLEDERAKFGDAAWALPVLRQIADGLAALHDAGVVHRDLKPANVLLTGDGAAPAAKISDFGISRFGALDQSAAIDPNAATLGASSPNAHALTGTGMVLGTPFYMAPEAARGGQTVEAPADVFALGIMAYELLTGNPPFAMPAFMLAMAGQDAPRPPTIDDPRVPAALGALVLECLVGDPSKRPKVAAVRAAMG